MVCVFRCDTVGVAYYGFLFTAYDGKWFFVIFRYELCCEPVLLWASYCIDMSDISSLSEVCVLMCYHDVREYWL